MSSAPTVFVLNSVVALQPPPGGGGGDANDGARCSEHAATKADARRVMLQQLIETRATSGLPCICITSAHMRGAAVTGVRVEQCSHRPMLIKKDATLRVSGVCTPWLNRVGVLHESLVHSHCTEHCALLTDTLQAEWKINIL
jgi:hypothetical protein